MIVKNYFWFKAKETKNSIKQENLEKLIVAPLVDKVFSFYAAQKPFTISTTDNHRCLT
jgi:hypothetical protein